MPIQSIQLDTTGITVALAQNNTITIPFNTLPPGNRNKKAEALKRMLQNFLDDRIPLDELPDDDPDKFTNPALPCLFWLEDEDNPGTYELCSRSILVTRVVWKPTLNYYSPTFTKLRC